MFTTEKLQQIAKHLHAKHEKKFPVGTHFCPILTSMIRGGDSESTDELFTPRIIGVPREWDWQENHVTIAPSKSPANQSLTVFYADTSFTAVMGTRGFLRARPSHKIVLTDLKSGIRVERTPSVPLPFHHGPDGTFWVSESDVRHILGITLEELCVLASILPDDPEIKQVEVLTTPRGLKPHEGTIREIPSVGKLHTLLSGIESMRRLRPGLVSLSEGTAECIADLAVKGFIRPSTVTYSL